MLHPYASPAPLKSQPVPRSTFELLHRFVLVLSLVPNLASWGAKWWWEAGQVPAASFKAWDGFFSSLSLFAFCPMLWLCGTTLYAALVLRQAKPTVVGALVLIASFVLGALGMLTVGYD